MIRAPLRTDDVRMWSADRPNTWLPRRRRQSPGEDANGLDGATGSRVVRSPASRIRGVVGSFVRDTYALKHDVCDVARFAGNAAWVTA